jgi:hypothetical protein
MGPRISIKRGFVVQLDTVTISRGINPRIGIRRPHRNICKINSFHHRNQITNAHVQIVSVNSS